MSSAALPALPIILEVLDLASDQIRIEILDILLGLAICSAETTEGEWYRELRRLLLTQEGRFLLLARDENEEIAGFADSILQALAKSAGEKARSAGG